MFTIFRLSKIHVFGSLDHLKFVPPISTQNVRKSKIELSLARETINCASRPIKSHQLLLQYRPAAGSCPSLIQRGTGAPRNIAPRHATSRPARADVLRIIWSSCLCNYPAFPLLDPRSFSIRP